MNTAKKETQFVIKAAYQRDVSIDENIFQTLSIHSFSLYMVLRFNADYRKDESEIICSAESLYTKAKIKRSQYYLCMNELENNGLVLRNPENKLGEKCAIHVAKQLNYFSEGVSQRDRGVHMVDRGVHDMDTDQCSYINITTNSGFKESANLVGSNKLKVNELMHELIDIYRQEFPNNPQPHKTLISTSLEKTLRTLIKRWPEADPNKKPITPESFRMYLTSLKKYSPNFSLKDYETPNGTRKKNGLETFCRWNTFVKFLENQYS